MSKDYLDRLNSQFDDHAATIDDLVSRALNEDRDLTPEEDAEAESHRQAMDNLTPQIERFKHIRETRHEQSVQRQTTPPAASDVIETVDGSAPRVQVTERDAVRDLYPTAGHLALDVYRASRGQFAARERVERALSQVKTSDVTGALPTVFAGDVRGRVHAVRPIVESGTRMPFPASGMQVRRPKITAHTSVAKQTTEKTEVSSSQFTVAYDTIDLVTLAGAVNVSVQAIERTDPSVLDMIFADQAGQYGLQSEALAAAELAAAAEGTVVPTADVAATTAAIYTAATEVYSATSGYFPNVIYAGTARWGALGAMARTVNPTDRQAVGEPSSFDMSFAGLKVVVSPALPADYLAVANTNFLEIYEPGSSPIELKALEVGILGFEVGVYGLFACKMFAEGFKRLDKAAV